MPSRERTAVPAVAWSWSRLLLGMAFAVPTAVLLPIDPQLGLGLAVGILPVAATGLPARRRSRIILLVLAVAAGTCILAGSLLGRHAWLAVVGIFALGLGTAVWSTRGRLGAVALTVCLPLVGIGFSFTDIAETTAIAGLMILSGGYAVLVSLLWPERPPPALTPPVTAATLDRGSAIDFGIRLGLAAATAAAIGFAPRT